MSYIVSQNVKWKHRQLGDSWGRNRLQFWIRWSLRRCWYTDKLNHCWRREGPEFALPDPSPLRAFLSLSRKEGPLSTHGQCLVLDSRHSPFSNYCQALGFYSCILSFPLCWEAVLVHRLSRPTSVTGVQAFHPWALQLCPGHSNSLCLICVMSNKRQIMVSI